MMKKKLAVLLALVLAVGLTACGNAGDSGQTEPASVKTETKQSEESTGQETIDSVESSNDTGSGKILIAYFAVAENSEVDAMVRKSVQRFEESNGAGSGDFRISCPLFFRMEIWINTLQHPLR